ncbi:MAG: hypothetical protein AB7I04_17570 [Pseudomonadales bacterium]
MMAETLQIVVCNVGGGRGRSRMWSEPTVACGFRAETAELDGRAVVILMRDGLLHDVLRVSGGAAALTRLTDYCYAPDVLAEVAARLGVQCARPAYHQGADVLPEMIATTTLPWRQG